MASPQTQDGFTRIANELFDAILMFPFSKREYVIVLAVIRKTYGYQKKTDTITNWQLSNMTGIDRQDVAKTVRSLVIKRVLTVGNSPTVIRGQQVPDIGINKHYEEWTTVGESPPVANHLRCKTPTVTVGKTPTVTVGNSPTTKESKEKKENNPLTPASGSRASGANPRSQKTNPRAQKQNPRAVDALPIADGICLQAWTDYETHRREIKARKLKPKSVDRLMAWLVEQGGYDTQQRIVDQTIRNGWTGLFELKANGNGTHQRSTARQFSDKLDAIAAAAHEREMGSGDFQETSGEIWAQVDKRIRGH